MHRRFPHVLVHGAADLDHHAGLGGVLVKEADSYALTQSYPDASGASKPVMYLDSIQRTGEDGTAVTLPAETFTPTEIDNRVDG